MWKDPSRYSLYKIDRINIHKKHMTHRETHKRMRRSRYFHEERARDVYPANRRLRPSRIYIVDLHADDTERKTETRVEYPGRRFDPPNSSSSIYYKTPYRFQRRRIIDKTREWLKVPESARIIPLYRCIAQSPYSFVFVPPCIIP